MNSDAYLYVACYCEENIWHLCQEKDFESFERKVVFISNPTRTCAFWNQRSRPAPDKAVIWDYHVILLLGRGGSWQIFDLDTLSSAPCSAFEYLDATFGRVSAVPKEFRPVFRVIDAQEFVDVFSSDRSHMLTPDGQWQVTPPLWEPIFRNERSNLMDLVDMEKSSIGTVMDYLQFENNFAR